MKTPLFTTTKELVAIRRCKCQVTGEFGTVSTFYRVRKNGKNKYYKSEQVYLDSIARKEARGDLLSYISVNILNYNSSQFLPPSFLKRIKELNEVYPYEVILSAFKENEDTLLYWVNQDGKFKDENNKLNYMLAIVRDKINDTYRKWEINKRREEENSTVSVEVGMMDVEFKNSSANSKKDISDFL